MDAFLFREKGSQRYFSVDILFFWLYCLFYVYDQQIFFLRELFWFLYVHYNSIVDRDVLTVEVGFSPDGQRVCGVISRVSHLHNVSVFVCPLFFSQNFSVRELLILLARRELIVVLLLHVRRWVCLLVRWFKLFVFFWNVGFMSLLEYFFWKCLRNFMR